MAFGISFETFLKIAPSVLDAKFPVLLRGRHGIGKSEVVYQIAKERKLPVIERRASQMTEGDLIGLPDVHGREVGGKKSTTFNPPDWYLQACAMPVALFIDEIDRATPEVRQGFFQLTDSRMLNGFRLHEGTLIFAAVNGGEASSQYQVGEMDPAELSRWTVFDLEPTVEDFLSWGKREVAGVRNVSKIVCDFIMQNPMHLEHKGTFDPNKVYPARRSWVRFDKTAILAGLFEEPKKTADTLLLLSNSFVGFEAATTFADYCRHIEAQVTVADILDKGKFDLVKDFAIADHANILEKIENSGAYDKKLTDKQIANLAKYFMILPGELAMKLITSSATKGKIGEQNMARLHASVVDGVPLSSRLVEILASEQNKMEEKN